MELSECNLGLYKNDAGADGLDLMDHVTDQVLTYLEVESVSLSFRPVSIKALSGDQNII